MKNIKRFLGIVWLLMGPVAIIFLCQQAMEKIGNTVNETERLNTALQWIIILLIFIPVCAGLVIFGWYAWKELYDEDPH